MARTRGERRPTRFPVNAVFPCRSLPSRKMLQQHLHQPLVDPLLFGDRVLDEYKEYDGDQETEAEVDHEEEEEDQEEEEEEEGEGEEEGDGRFGIGKAINGVSGPGNQYPSSLYPLPENDNGYDNSSDDHGRNEQRRTHPGKSRNFSDPELDTETIKEENDDETSMDRLRVWLDRMGLGKYAPLFEFHDVDDEVLRFLTLQDLKDMGVSAVGSRWKIYRYIQKFCI